MKNTNLPNQWSTARVGDYLYLKNGYAFKSSDYLKANQKGFPVIRISDLDGSIASNENAVRVSFQSPGFEVVNGDLLIAMSGATTGKIGVYRGDEPAYQNQRVGNLKLISEQYGSAPFRNFLIKYLSDQILKIAYGGAQPNISGKAIEDIEIKLPPLAEQKIIAEKLDDMLAKVERIKARLERIPQILKQFRQSVLADAVSGKLTEDWRPSNQGESKKIVDLLKNRNSHKPKPFEPSDPPYEIPQTWTWVRLGEIFSLKSGTTINQNDELTEGEIPYFKVGDMNQLNNNYYMVTATKFVSSNTVSSNSLLDKGMIVFPKRGGAIGTNKKRILKQKSLVDLNTMGINTNGMNISFVYNWFLTVDLGKLNSGSTVPQINNGDIEPLWIPIPPEKEQLEITKRLEILFAYADKIDKQNAVALGKVNDLTQSILAKAFKGELTEKWRIENPDLISGEKSAEALLTKIKAEIKKK